MATLEKTVFKMFSELIYDETGIFLGENKQALVSSRLGKRMRYLNIEDYHEYYKYVRKDRSRKEMGNLLDAISTNVTGFFREPDHFELLTSLVRKWEAQGQIRFRFWSAACSTGEEPYSMGVTISEASKNIGDAKILATDISRSVLTTAMKGNYRAKSLEKVSTKIVDKYFTPIRKNGENTYWVKESIKKMVRFSWLNLSNPPYPMKGPLDIVFCRNVMIYFDRRVKERLLEEMCRLLKPGGYLLVGHAESISGLCDGFKIVCPSVYIKK